MKKPKITKLLLSGGGIKGAAICGAIEKLDEEIKIMSTVKTIIGTSISAYIAFFLALGFSIRRVKVVFENLNFSDFQEFDIKLLLSKFGLDDGTKFNLFVKATLTTQNFNPCMTFKELKELSKYNIILTGTNINTAKPVYFSAEHTPDMQVCQALRISGGYPFVFTPIEIDGELYADGGLTSPIASELIKKKDNNNTLAIVLHRGFSKYKTDDLKSYGIGVISCLVDSLLDSKLLNIKHSIVISYPLSSMEFGVDKEEKNKMIEFGREKAAEWLNKFTDS